MMLKSIFNAKVTVNYTSNLKLIKFVVKNPHNFSTNANRKKIIIQHSLNYHSHTINQTKIYILTNASRYPIVVSKIKILFWAL